MTPHRLALCAATTLLLLLSACGHDDAPAAEDPTSPPTSPALHCAPEPGSTTLASQACTNPDGKTGGATS